MSTNNQPQIKIVQRYAKSTKIDAAEIHRQAIMAGENAGENAGYNIGLDFGTTNSIISYLGTTGAILPFVIRLNDH